MSKKIKDEQKKFLGGTLNQYDKALKEGINQLDKKNREQNHKISSLVNSFDNEYLEKDVEGNMTTLENSKDGMVIINEIQGNTEVNYCKDGEKELILNSDIDTQGKSFVTLTEGVDGGLVDVSLEGNTEVNLSSTKDPVLVTREFDDINCNSGKLQYTIDDVTTINDEPGKVDIDRIVGDTMVNHAVNGSEELILNAHINESGDNNITLNGVTSDGGKVDVALEGNTMVNVCDQKDPVAITKSYTVETGNHVALQGEYDGKCRPVVTGNTLVNLIDCPKTHVEANGTYVNIFDTGDVHLIKPNTDYTFIVEINNLVDISYIELNSAFLEEQCFSYISKTNLNNGICTIKATSKSDLSSATVIINTRITPDSTTGSMDISIMLLEGDYTDKPIPDYFEGLQSSFEDKVVTQEMVDNGEELAENLGKYKVEYKVTGKNKFDQSSHIDSSNPENIYRKFTKLIKYDNNKDYFLSVNNKVPNIYVYAYWYDSNKKQIRYDIYDYSNKIIPKDRIPTNTKYIAFELRHIGSNLSIDAVNNVKLQLEEGTEATPYEPYKEYTKTLYLNSPLLEGDTIEEKDGNIYHVHRYNSKAYETGDENTYITDLINTICPLETPTYELIQQGTIVMPTYSSGHLDVTTAVPLDKVNFLHFEEELTYLYPSTSYTVQFNSDNAITVDITLGGKKLMAQSIIVGLNKITITTPETLTDNKLIIDGVGASISEVVVTNSNREFGYFEGMKSVGECEDLEVVSCNKNLWNVTQDTPFYSAYRFGVELTIRSNTITADGDFKIVENNSEHYGRGPILKLEIGKTYTLSATIKSLGGANSIYFQIASPTDDIWRRTLFSEEGKRCSVTFTTDINTNYVMFSPLVLDGTPTSDVLLSDIQLEEGSTATDYIPHQSNTQTLTHEPLRAVGNIKDKYVLIDGKWYIERKCGKAVLDGTNHIIKQRDTDISTKKRWMVYNDSSIKDVDEYNITIINNKYRSITANTSWLALEDGISQNSVGNAIHIYLERYSDGSNVSKQALISELQQNPVTIVYQLAQPVYEPIDYNPFEVYSDTTHITTNSTIPTNITIKNHGYNLVALKENTQYTLYVNKDTTNAITYRLGDYVEINSLSKFTFTTPSTLTDKTLRIEGKGAKVNNLMLIEGTPTNDSIGYFDGLKSSYECEQVTDENDENYGKYKVDIKVVGKNKFDGQWQKNEGVYGVYYYGKGTYTISIQEKDLSLLDNSCSLGHANLDGSNVTWLYSDGTIWRHSITLTNGKLVFRMPTEEGLELLKRAFDIQIEEGNTATEYEPYFESKQTIYLNSPLLKGDEIVWKDNKIQHYHKMKTVVFDGSEDENWIKQGDDWDTDNRITFKISLPKSNLQWWSLENEISTAQNRMSKKVLSDKFTYIYDIPNESINKFIGQDGDIGHFGSSARYLVIGLLKAKLQTQNVVGFKQWLQQNPITVAYQLAEPTYEEISVYPLKLNAIANSSLSTESTIQVTNISFNVYEETLPYLYPNTKYYITFNADVDRNNIVIDLGGNHVVFDCKVGFNKVEITTPSNTTNLLTFSGTGVNIDHVKVTQQDIDEYFEGMKSVGECEELEITSANSDNTLLNTQQLTHEPLRAVGEVKDRYVLIDNKWYIERRCGEIALENIQWEYNSTITNSGNTFAYTGGIDNILVQSQVTKNYFLCNIVEATKVHNHEVDKEQITQFIHSSGIALRISRDKLQDNSVNSLNEFLLNNNAKLVYQLKTPVYEPIDYNPFETYTDITHITTNSLIPTNMVIKNHGYNCILKPSTTYTVALNKPNGIISAKLGGSAKVDSTNSIFTITTPSTLNDNVLRLSGSGNVKDIIILEGDKTINTPSYFEGIESVFEQEYDTEKGKYRVTAKVVGDGKESTITFYINEPLRGTATSKDKVFIKDNKVIVQRNIKEMLLNGSEDWKYRETRSDGYLYTLDIPDLKKYGVNTYEQGYTDRFYMKDLLPFGAFFEYVNGRDICLQLPLALGGDNANVIKDWLNVNNTRVVYELAEPVYEEADCGLSKLVLENYENSSLIFESNIPVSANIRYSGEVPVVTQAKSLSSQVDNTTLDINENIIPYMCDIDYRIVELQLMNGDTQGEGIELLGIGDIEILSNENVLFNNREDKKYNYSYDMLKRDILSQRYSKEEYQYRLDRYLLANKISNEEYKELEGLLNNGE